MGSVDISLAEVLMFPQNKIQLTTKVMSVLTDCDHNDSYCGCNIKMTKPRHLGNLTLWFRLTCELDVLKSLYNEFDQWRSSNINSNTKPNAELISSNQRKSKAESFHFEFKSTANNPNTNNSLIDEKTLIAVTIQCLRLNNSLEIKTNTTEQIHIECNFLGSRRLKTEPKLLSTNELLFNFTHKFIHNERTVQRLISAIKDSEYSVKFMLIKTKTMQNASSNNDAISEDESKMDGIEIGFGLLHLGKFIQNLSDNDCNARHTFLIPILSKTPPYQNIGDLDISIENIVELKHMRNKHFDQNNAVE